ncbi:flagellar biosynthesis protein FlhB [Caloramator sp. E03]|uniref:flagellar biosynthesis protein FlhB n=1 Tax=Caloramator sp. E03 TaxID=2576307 RepID=UPI001110186E|nr:flagellar biosynthesis protein FlhB [Caloramator sp. E03]QCX32338.1 flagellar biosynthesis protein FlhB [Caloramator sp. E03]
MEQNFIVYLLSTVRIVSMLVSSPIFSVRQIPALLKVGLSLSIGLIISPTINSTEFYIPHTLTELVISVAIEIFIGVLIGYVATLIFNAVRVSAQLMDFTIGFSMSQYYDPSTAGNSTPLERFFNWFAIIIFLTFNFHHIIISAIIKSFEVVPIGKSVINLNYFPVLISIFSKSFYIAMQLAAPIVIVIFITDFTLGLLSRTVPQLNIFMLSLPAKILVGITVISAILPGLLHIYVKVFENMSGNFIKILNAIPFIMLFASDDKTEEPTAKKLQEAKKKGQVPKSIDLNSAIILLGVTILLSIIGELYYKNGRNFLIQSFKYITKEDLSIQKLNNVVLFGLKNGFLAAMPIVFTVMLLGIIANISQMGLILTNESLKFKFERINPIEGMKRFFNKRTYFELIKSILKIGIISYVVFSYIKTKLSDILKTSDLNPNGIYPFVKSIVDAQLVRLVIFLFAIGIFDYIFQKRQYKKDLRMTKQEVKEELKQMEGDPQIKSRIKQKQRELAMRRMMHEVPKATVVITNPTHFAVALRYEREKDPAPRVVAKGCDLVAQKIKEIAKKNNVPIVENKDLARTIYSKVEIDDVIPYELYQAVAEIIAYIYSIKNN